MIRKIFFIRFRDGTYQGRYRKKVSFEKARLFESEKVLKRFILNKKLKEPYDLLEFEVDNEIE